jgi:hypothetical protein
MNAAFCARDTTTAFSVRCDGGRANSHRRPGRRGP